MIPSLEQLRTISKSKWTKVNEDNARSVVSSLATFASRPEVQLDLPHRLAQFLAQMFHESGAFRYDEEIWGNTPAQKRYDTRTDLGNTPAADGDGKKYKGRTAGQITGGGNYKAFTKWARKLDPSAPDFYANPELINTDPWEGLGFIWYWTVGNPTGKSLNVYADTNDIEMITRKVNGGTNGLEDRIEYYSRVGLVLLGYGPEQVEKFQMDAGLEADGIPGPQTRAKIHEKLALRAARTIAADETINVKKAPVTQKVEVAVAPPGVEKPGGDIGKVVTAVAAAGGAQVVEPVLGAFGGLGMVVQLVLIGVAVGAVVWFIVDRRKMARRAAAITTMIKEKHQDGLPN